jgi:hypothetical protein
MFPDEKNIKKPETKRSGSWQCPSQHTKSRPKPSAMEDEQRNAFSAYAQQSGLRASSAEWTSNSSLLVLPSHRAREIVFRLPCRDCGDGKSSLRVLPVNGCPIAFNGPNFEGKLVSRIRDADTTSNVEGNLLPNKQYFHNRSRQYHWCVQGRFKKRVRFDKVVTGQDFGRPFRNRPSSLVVKKALELLKSKLPESFHCDLLSDEPRIEHPLLSGCQHFRIDRPEDLEGVLDEDMHGIGEDGNVIEDTRLLGDDSVPQDGIARRKYFAKNCNLERFYFEPGFVYTFDTYVNFFSPARYRMELTTFFSVDVIPLFNGYPLLMSMAKEKDNGEYFWATEMWHQRLLNYDEKPGPLARLFTEKA